MSSGEGNAGVFGVFGLDRGEGAVSSFKLSRCKDRPR